MNKQVLCVLLVLGLQAVSSGESEPEPEAAADKTWNRMLVAGCGLDKMLIIDRAGQVLWSMATEDESCDAWMLESGNIIYSCRRDGTKIVKPDYQSGKGGEVIWHRPVPDGCETHSCQPLGQGRFLIGESYDGVSYVLEIDTEGKEYQRIELKGIGSKHKTFRVIRKTPQGTYLVAGQGEGYKGRRAMEIDRTGKVIRRFPGGGFLAVRLPDGNTLLSSGDRHLGDCVARVFEVDPAGRIVWKLEKRDLPEGMTLGYVAGVQRLPNGNTLVCNAKYHMGPEGDPGPAIFEITPEKKIVWTWDAEPRNLVTSVMVLDKKTQKQGSWR